MTTSGARVWVCEMYEEGEKTGPVRVFSSEHALNLFIHQQRDEITTVSYEQIVDQPEAFDGRHRMN